MDPDFDPEPALHVIVALLVAALIATIIAACSIL